MYVCFMLQSDCFCRLTSQRVDIYMWEEFINVYLLMTWVWYICEKSLEMCICLWHEFDCLGVILCGWQDIKIQLLLLLQRRQTAENMAGLFFWGNLHIREIINARKTSHKHNNKDLSRLRKLSPGMRVNTWYRHSPRGTSSIFRTDALGLTKDCN